MSTVSVVVPNWNGAEHLAPCLDSLIGQSQEARIIVVDNGSTDDSIKLLQRDYPSVELVALPKNQGFAGGVNAGIRHSMEKGTDYIALFNNDAVADKNWIKNLLVGLDNNHEIGITTSKIINDTGEYLDSTGEMYTIWGLSYPRGRGEAEINKYDSDLNIFGASGGASLYRARMLSEIGLFDEDFFAYYEDVDLSFRAQLAGWKVRYVPSAVVHHQIGKTSSKIKGLTTYQTLKNLPLLLWKNVPWKLMPRIWPRLVVAYLAIAGSALLRGQFGAFFKGILVGTWLWPKKLVQRRQIQKNRRVSSEYINSIITHDLPPEAHKLRALRHKWWRLRGKKAMSDII